MTPKDWFTVALRILGVWRVLASIDGFVSCYGVATNLIRTDLYTAQSYLTQAAMDAFAAVILLFLAPRIAAFFYEPVRVKPSDPPSA